jgi:hypothetical protein
MDHRKFLPASLIMAAAMLLTGPGMAAEPGIFAVRIPGSGPIMDPDADFWNKTPGFKVKLLPQTATTPANPNPATQTIIVRAVHNGGWVGIRVEWEDVTQSDRIVVDEFGDQVAIEFPVEYRPDALPSPMMGSPGRRVDIWQWRAAFQSDLDQGEPDIRDLYPNTMVDVYPDEVLRVTDARAYTGALGVDNLVSHPRGSPVLEQTAEGFGTLTALPEDQDADGRGFWRDGKWHVVFTHPFAPYSKNSAQFAAGGETVAAFAVWEGGHREVGARKAWSVWVPFRLAK